MRFPTRYGDTKLPSCPFCGRNALNKNAQGVPVCSAHRSQNLPETDCACGTRLEMKQGKWGPFFLCHSCGSQGMPKVLSLMKARGADPAKPATCLSPEKKSEKKEFTITTNDVEWF